MEGMHYHTGSASGFGFDKPYSVSAQFRLPKPTPTLAQISLTSFVEFGQEGVSWADLGFTEIEFVDDNGQTRTAQFSDPSSVGAVRAFSNGRLKAATFQIQMFRGSGSFLANFFFWNSVL
jgi:hypothetical protein